MPPWNTWPGKALTAVQRQCGFVRPSALPLSLPSSPHGWHYTPMRHPVNVARWRPSMGCHMPADKALAPWCLLVYPQRTVYEMSPEARRPRGAGRAPLDTGDAGRSERTMADTTEGLLRITGCEQPERLADVVFVHGLDGDARSTWHPRGQPELFWPDWLGADVPRLGVWSLGYAVSASAWKGHSMPL